MKFVIGGGARLKCQRRDQLDETFYMITVSQQLWISTLFLYVNHNAEWALATSTEFLHDKAFYQQMVYLSCIYILDEIVLNLITAAAHLHHEMAIIALTLMSQTRIFACARIALFQFSGVGILHCKL